MTPSLVRARLLAVLLAAALTAAATAAEPQPPKGNVLKLGGGQPAGKLLTRDELRHCLKEEGELKTDAERTARGRTALDAEKQAIAAAEADLAAQRTTIDATSEAAVNEFNVKLGALRQRSEAYKASALAFNGEAEAYNGRQQAYVGACANRPYDERDYFAIQRGK